MFLIYILIFMFGTAIGSFLNVVILRLKAGEKFMFGRSRCPKCGHIIKWYENIPVLSFIILRAKCSQCRKSISWQYPIVELMTGILFALAYAVAMKQFNNESAVTLSNCYTLIVFYWIVISSLILIFVYDYKYFLIPDKISLPAIVGVAIFQFMLLILKKNFNHPWLLAADYWLFIFSGIIISGFFWLQFVVSRGKWIGGGDIRLGFLMGVILGWPLALVALFLAYILGLIITLPLLMWGKKGLKSQVPLGTFLTAATIITLFFGNQILDWYLSFLHL